MLFRYTLVILSWVMLLVACGEIPHPYKLRDESQKLSNALITPNDARGIYFHQTSTDEDDQRFAELLMAQLVDYNIPVTRTDSLDRGYHLAGSLAKGQTEIRYVWDFFDHTEAQPETRETALPISTDFTAYEAEKQLARQIALHIAMKLKPGVIEALDKQRDLDNISIKIRQIVGAPGDGNNSLKRNIIAILKQAGIKIAPDEGQKKTARKETNQKPETRAELVVSGIIVVEPLNEGQDQVRIDWLFEDHRGKEYRRIQQKNNIPAGQLDGPWGEIAYIIAAVVAEDIAFTLDEILSQHTK